MRTAAFVLLAKRTLEDTAKEFSAAHGYDTDLTDLVVNETQSLLCFTPAFDPTALGLTQSQVQSLRTRFLQKIPLAWLKRAGALPLHPGKGGAFAIHSQEPDPNRVRKNAKALKR